MYANGEKLGWGSTYKETEWGGKKLLFAHDVVAKIKEGDPMYEPSAYLNGTADPSSLKWLMATRVVFNGKVMGYVSPRFQEIIQDGYHLLKGRYLSYVKPNFIRKARLSSFIASIFDRKMRRISLRILGQMLKNPVNIFRRAFFQSLMVIQPVNITKDGTQDMCDACPDITVHDGRLVWSCRLEELNHFGSFFTFVPKSKKQGLGH